MHIIERILKPMSYFMIVAMLGVVLPLRPAQAAMVGTAAVMNPTQAQNARAQVQAFLDRKEVRAQLQGMGISPSEAKARVASLSDRQVTQIAGKLNQLPAGGDAIGSIVGAAVLIFIVLLITDLLGLTHVFPFVNHPARR